LGDFLPGDRELDLIETWPAHRGPKQLICRPLRILPWPAGLLSGRLLPVHLIKEILTQSFDGFLFFLGQVQGGKINALKDKGRPR
jgi:hypothetical protein